MRRNRQEEPRPSSQATVVAGSLVLAVLGGAALYFLAVSKGSEVGEADGGSNEADSGKSAAAPGSLATTAEGDGRTTKSEPRPLSTSTSSIQPQVADTVQAEAAEGESRESEEDEPEEEESEGLSDYPQKYAVLVAVTALSVFGSYLSIKQWWQWELQLDPNAASIELVEVGENEPAVTARVSLEVEIGGEEVGKIMIGLFGDAAPDTVDNFRGLCKHSQGYGYRGSVFHRVVPGLGIQGGDYERSNGTGGRSIWGKPFKDENLRLSHAKPGMLTMANAGKDTNGSQFLITTAAAPQLDGKHVVFGKVLEGMNIVRRIEEQATDNNHRPLADCVIIGTGNVG